MKPEGTSTSIPCTSLPSPLSEGSSGVSDTSQNSLPLVSKAIPGQPAFIDSNAVKKQFADREIKLKSDFQREPATHISNAAIELHFGLEQLTEVESDQAKMDFGVPFTFYPIGANSSVFLSEAPTRQEDTLKFWKNIVDKKVTTIVNINPEGSAENYYPSGATIQLSEPGLVVKEVTSAREFESSDASSGEEDEPPLKKFKVQKPLLRRLEPAELSIEYAGIKHASVLYKVTDWVDARGYDPDALIAFARELPERQTLIHCRAGLGRSGTLAVIKQLLIFQQQGSLTKNNCIEVLAKLILEGRKQRQDSRFVTTTAQIETLFQVLKHILGCSEGRLVRKTNELLELR